MPVKLAQRPVELFQTDQVCSGRDLCQASQQQGSSGLLAMLAEQYQSKLIAKPSEERHMEIVSLKTIGRQSNLV